MHSCNDDVTFFSNIADSWCLSTHSNNAFAFRSACSATGEGILNASSANRVLQAYAKRLHFSSPVTQKQTLLNHRYYSIYD